MFYGRLALYGSIRSSYDKIMISLVNIKVSLHYIPGYLGAPIFEISYHGGQCLVYHSTNTMADENVLAQEV